MWRPSFCLWSPSSTVRRELAVSSIPANQMSSIARHWTRPHCESDSEGKKKRAPLNHHLPPGSEGREGESSPWKRGARQASWLFTGGADLVPFSPDQRRAEGACQSRSHHHTRQGGITNTREVQASHKSQRLQRCISRRERRDQLPAATATSLEGVGFCGCMQSPPPLSTRD